MFELDRSAARRATIAAAVTLALLLVAQSVVAAAVTGDEQPLTAVDSVPQAADGQQWSDAPSRTVSLSKQQMAVPYGGGSVDEMDVQALTNESHVAIRLTWQDPTRDTSLAAPGNYSDAAAVMLHSGEQPPIMMGGSGDPVNIWYWRSHWQYGTEDRAEWAGDMYAYPHPDDETKPGQAAGNPLARASYDNYGQNYYASGFGSLSHAPEQNVQARGSRNGEEWSVVFVREHTTNGTEDAVFEREEPMYLAFAVWNGSKAEVNGKKSITLQFSTLDTASGELAAADSGGGSADAGGESAGSGDSNSDSGTEIPTVTSYIGTLVAAVLVSWSVIYWRATR